jgi:ABC-type polysaccharide/polyol phosphate export permease
MLKIYKMGTKDLITAFLHFSQWCYLGLQDIRMRYRRSLLGPWWVTISNLIMIGVLGILWSKLLNKPLHEFLPFFAIGYTIWQWISAIFFEATQGFVPFKVIMTQVKLPLSSYILRVNFRQLIILFHNLIVILIALLFAQHFTSFWNYFISLFGIMILVLNLFFLTIIIQIFCTRFQDMAKVFETFIQVAFFFTPILWDPSLLKEYRFLIDFNIFYHWIEAIRMPMLELHFDYFHIVISLLSAIILFILSMFCLGSKKNKVTFWL